MNWIEKVKVRDAFSSWREILYGVPHGSSLGQLLLNAFLSDFYFFLKQADIATYADIPSIPWNASLTHKLVILERQEKLSLFFKWSHNNYMKVNGDNSDLLMSGNNAIADIDNNRILSEWTWTPWNNYCLKADIQKPF